MGSGVPPIYIDLCQPCSMATYCTMNAGYPNDCSSAISKWAEVEGARARADRLAQMVTDR
jgi:hypothetical protein